MNPSEQKTPKTSTFVRTTHLAPQKTHNGEKFLKNGKTPKICAKFPWHTTDSAGTRVSFRPPSNVSAPARTTLGARYWEPSSP